MRGKPSLRAYAKQSSLLLARSADTNFSPFTFHFFYSIYNGGMGWVKKSTDGGESAVGLYFPERNWKEFFTLCKQPHYQISYLHTTLDHAHNSCWTRGRCCRSHPWSRSNHDHHRSRFRTRSRRC